MIEKKINLSAVSSPAPAPFFEPWELSQVLPSEQRAEYRTGLQARIKEYRRRNPLQQAAQSKEAQAAILAEAIKDPAKRQQIAVILVNTGYLSPDYLTAD